MYPSLQEPNLYEYEATPKPPTIPTEQSSISASSGPEKLKITVEGHEKFYYLPLKETHTVKRVQELVS